MFTLELYKFVRSRQLIWMGLSLLIPFSLVFLGDLENESNFYYHPLFNKVDLSWLHFSRNYDDFLFFFFPILIIILYAGNIYLDKNAGLLKVFTMASMSKIKFWLTKYLFLQIITLIYILFYLCLAVFLYVLIHDPPTIGLTFFQTGLFLSLKSWVALASITTIIFIIQILSTSFYLGLLLPMILYIWMFFLPGSPLVLFARSIHYMQDLTSNEHPFVWNMNSFHWEYISLVFALTLVIFLILIIFLFRNMVYFKRMFFGVAACILILTSCQNDGKQAIKFHIISSIAQKDSFLIDWVDTVRILDRENTSISLKSILESNSASVIYLDFWNSHCIPCMKAFPRLDELSHEYSAEDLKIIYLNSDEDPERWAKALSFTGNLALPDHYRILYPDFKTLAKVGLNLYPRYMVMNQKRAVIEFRAPVPDKEYIDSLLSIEQCKPLKFM